MKRTRTVITEALENTIEGMLLSGKRGSDIADQLNISTASVSKIRRKLIAQGKGFLWHTDNYLDSRSWT